jgi:molybdopterin converting factor small subunit
MVSVTIRLMGDLRRFAGVQSVEIEGGACSLGTAIEELTRRHPGLTSQLFDDRGRLRYTTLLVMNGHSATWPQDRDGLIEDGGELLLMRFLAGG